MSAEVWIQLWSGTMGAVFGAVFGAGTAVLVLFWSNKHQSKLSMAALEEQARLAKTQMEEQARLAQAQLVDQREERRETREIEALSELLQFISMLVEEEPQDLKFISGLVRRCDQLTLNSRHEVASHWSKTMHASQLGVTRHPLAEAISTLLALRQITSEVEAGIASLYGGTFPTEMNGLLGGRALGWHQFRSDIARTLQSALQWQSLSDKKKCTLFDGIRDRERLTAAKFVAAVSLLLSARGYNDIMWNGLSISDDFRPHRSLIGAFPVSHDVQAHAAVSPDFEERFDRLCARLPELRPAAGVPAH